MFHATAVRTTGKGFTPDLITVARSVTIAECLKQLGTRTGDMAAVWDLDKRITDEEAEGILRTERPDMVTILHRKGFVLTLHEDHLKDFALPSPRS